MPSQAEYQLPPQSFKPERPLETPFLRAKQEWDEVFGKTVVRAKNWRFVAVISLLIAFISLIAFVVEAQKQKFIPMVVTVNSKTGAPEVFGEVLSPNHAPNVLEIKYFLSQFISKVRSVPLDPIIIKKNWEDAYFLLSRESAAKLNASVNDDPNHPLHSIGTTTVSVEPISIVQVAGGNSYQARWKESLYGKRGKKEDEYTMTGIFTIEINPPETKDGILKNPLGIFIRDFQWNRELTGDKR